MGRRCDSCNGEMHDGMSKACKQLCEYRCNPDNDIYRVRYALASFEYTIDGFEFTGIVDIQRSKEQILRLKDALEADLKSGDKYNTADYYELVTVEARHSHKHGANVENLDGYWFLS